ADYRLERIEGGASSGAGSTPRWELHNRTADGREQVFRELVFHGGPGETLEMRVFSLPDLEQHFATAGFTDLTVFDRDVPECGIVIHQAWSLTMTARRPRAT